MSVCINDQRKEIPSNHQPSSSPHKLPSTHMTTLKRNLNWIDMLFSWIVLFIVMYLPTLPQMVSHKTVTPTVTNRLPQRSKSRGSRRLVCCLPFVLPFLCFPCRFPSLPADDDNHSFLDGNGYENNHQKGEMMQEERVWAIRSR